MDDLAYLLGRMRDTGTPTYTDDPDGGNMKPWQMTGSYGALDRDKYQSQNDLTSSFLQQSGNGKSWQDRMDLEKALMDKFLQDQMRLRAWKAQQGVIPNRLSNDYNRQLPQPPAWGSSNTSLMNSLMNDPRQQQQLQMKLYRPGVQEM